MIFSRLRGVTGNVGTLLRAHPAILWLTVYAFLVLIRVPAILTHGRFWAEEGKVFYHNAATMSPFHALFNSYAGYLNLPTNAATLLAWKLFPVDYAPYFTTFVGLFFQLLPPYLIVTARDVWLRSPVVRAVALAAVLFIPASNEIWLQSLHAQINLALCCALILALNPAGGWLRSAILFIAPLGGPGSIVFLPLFLLRAMTDRSLLRFRQAILLAISSAIQLAFFYNHEPGRGAASWLGPAMVAVFCREPLYLILGRFSGLLHQLVPALHDQMVARPNSFSWADPALVLFFTPFMVAGLIWERCRVCLWLLLGNAAFTGAAMFGALGGAAEQIAELGGERYVYVGQVLCELMVLAFAVTAKRWPLRIFAWMLVLWMIIVGGEIAYWHRSFVQGGTRSVWSEEVRKWRADHHYQFHLWPDGWGMELP